MNKEKKRPKTAVIAFIQGLGDEANFKSKDVAPSNTDKVEIPTAAGTLIPRKFDHLQETQLYKLPSGKKSRFIPKTISSKNCRAWAGNSRDQTKLENENLEDLKAIIAVQGQQVPVLARPIKTPNTENFTHEVIYGSRRLKVCQQLGLEIKIIEADLSDEDALLLMEAENSGRQNISLYEKAKAYHKWVEEKRFDSYVDLAQKLGMSQRWVFKVISLLNLPDFLIEAIPNLNELTKLRAERILFLLNKNSNATEKIQIAINALKNEKNDYTSEELFKRIFTEFQKNSKKDLEGIEEREVCGIDGEKILVVRTSRTGKISIDINKHITPQRVARLLDGLEKMARKV
jgi:ParB family chromosome partitioning protein